MTHPKLSALFALSPGAKTGRAIFNVAFHGFRVHFPSEGVNRSVAGRGHVECERGF